MKYVRRHCCITPPSTISDFLKGKKTIVSITQTHFESSTYVNELTEGALLFFLRSLRNDDGEDCATKTSLKKLICAASNLGPVYMEWGTLV